MPKVLNARLILQDEGPKSNLTTSTRLYVGRPTFWGNPFVIGRDGSREEVIEKHRLWLPNSEVSRWTFELRGKDLVCWCAPEACHADILLELANK